MHIVVMMMMQSYALIETCLIEQIFLSVCIEKYDRRVILHPTHPDRKRCRNDRYAEDSIAKHERFAKRFATERERVHSVQDRITGNSIQCCCRHHSRCHC